MTKYGQPKKLSRRAYPLRLDVTISKSSIGWMLFPRVLASSIGSARSSISQLIWAHAHPWSRYPGSPISYRITWRYRQGPAAEWLLPEQARQTTPAIATTKEFQRTAFTRNIFPSSSSRPVGVYRAVKLTMAGFSSASRDGRISAPPFVRGSAREIRERGTRGGMP